MNRLTIEEVKDQYEQQLMAIAGVTGVGISLTKDHRQPCIKVFVHPQASYQTAQIPRVLDGYPVEVETKAFRAL